MSGLFIGVCVLSTVAAIIGLLVWFILHKDKQVFTFRLFLTAYFYIVSALSLLAIVFGGASVTKALLSDAFGRSFSYYSYEDTVSMPEPGVTEDKSQAVISESEQQKIKQQQQATIEAEYKDDIFTGVSLMVVGLLFMLVHTFGWMKLEPAKDRRQSVLYKGYIMMQLAIYSVGTLISLPVAISQSLRYWLDGSQNGSLQPGEMLAVAIWVTPVWLVFIAWTMRVLHKED